MTDASADTIKPALGAREAERAARAEGASRWQSFPVVPFALTIVFLGLVFVPPVRGNPRLVWTFLGVGAVMLAWEAIVWIVARARGQVLRTEFVPVKSHYVQASVHLCVLAYWGWYARQVYVEAPLILAQVIFLYILDALVSWSRGWSWRIGFGPLPIIFSTNLLLWFRDDWFVFQFLMVAAGALGKHFITWKRDGRRIHIFNPSVLGQTLVAVVLIATGTSAKYTFGKEIAATFETPPHIFLEIFLLGLIVQYFFHVTLMTLSAVATLCAFNLIYTHMTGSYWFIATNIGSPVFLGMHLLVTDPSTSPRSNVGKVLFGALYAVGYLVLFRVFENTGSPLFWDKLLPVFVLNLAVPLIDRVARLGLIGRFNHWWETALQPRALNLVHMGCWATLFLTMLGTGFVEAPHPGSTIDFWKKAADAGDARAGRNLLRMAIYGAAHGSGPACNELGVISMEGKLSKRDPAAAKNYFARASALGDSQGRANLVRLFLFMEQGEPDDAVTRALGQLEQECFAGTDGGSCFLIGFAYERGRGRPPDRGLALLLYDKGCSLGNEDACKAAARLRP